MDNQKNLELLDAKQMLLSYNGSENIDDSFELAEIENQLEEELEAQISELKFLEEEKEKIGSPDNLGETIKGVVWEQFINQIAVKAGTDFIEENRGLTLDLRKEAHYQSSENFASGKIATHNTEIDYQQRYNDWQSNFQRDEDGNIKTTYDNRTGKQKETLRVRNTKKDPEGQNYNLNYNARGDFDKGRAVGSNGNHKDHTISAAEIIRDPEANAHLTRAEQIAFANSDKNLNDMNSAANQSKGDSTMEEFLNSERDGKKPAERFGLDEKKLRKKDKEAREEYKKVKKEGEKRSEEAGRKSRQNEAFRIGGKMLRTVVMQLLAELVKEIIGKLVLWFKEAQRTLKALIEYIKEAIMSFLSKLKTHVINAGSSALTTLATAIIGPVVGLIKKVWTMLKQGWKSLKEAVEYIKNPKNKGMPIDRLILEVGKIVIAGLTGIGAMVLGEIIEKGLMAIPGIGAAFAFEIPMLGSLASLIGIFLGGVIAGIIGAIAINMIQKKIESTQMQENTNSQIEIGNEIVSTQYQLIDIKEEKLQRMEQDVETIIVNRHKEAENIIKDSIGNILNNVRSNINDGEEIKKINDGLADLL